MRTEDAAWSANPRRRLMSTQDVAAPDSAESANGEVEFPARPPAPVQMHELDFLLGEFRCEYTNLTTDPVSSGVATWTTVPILGGHYYEMTQTVPVPGVSSRWVFGWNQADSTFFTSYYDDWGNHGATKCEGWQDGELKCTGDYFAFGQPFVFQEVFAQVDDDHYTKHGFVRQADAWVPVDVIHCHRV
ncbi:DUF1579 family protein [Amycolatopsis sp. NPDC005232]|uniref:DUF1579 family protein n=1 Tax=Amycolatopsis sp. NPDC005232 TaxID=3157027 RepID=UPI0033A13BB3